MTQPARPSPTIGVFDSGFGGLTVLRELLPLIPGARYLYLGDTARLPYGSKSHATIARYAAESARFLIDRGCEHLVIACNTASALALPEIRAVAGRVLVTGVIEPGAHAAAQSSPGPGAHALVLATAATVQSRAYTLALSRLGLAVTEKACPLLVPLIEEGWIDHPVTREVLRIYLREALDICSPGVVILGCTHYPLIAPLVVETLRQLGSNAAVVDSARTTAFAVAQTLGARPPAAEDALATFHCYATDSTEKFARLGSQFLDRPIPDVELLDLGG